MKKTVKKIMGKKKGGDILVSVIIFAAIAVTVITGLVNWGGELLSDIRSAATKEQAFQIAEAGIDYYRWHLAQYPTDYQDGTATSGPYYHNFYDKNGNLIGQYALSITAPLAGSTKVTITSTGTTTASPTLKRVIQAALAEPSLAQYAVVASDYLRFGAGTVVNGPITSNKGIHFDGTANNIVSSAMATYTDPDWDGNPNDNNSGGSCTNVSYGVHTCISPADPSPPSAMATNTAVFTAGRQVSVPAVDFTGLLSNLSTLLTVADGGGSCTSAPCWKPSGSLGYHMVINGSTYTMYKVTALQSTPNNCTNDANETGWGTWSIQVNGSGTITGQSSAIGTYSFPANGVVFVEDNLWVDGQTNGVRATIAAGFGSNGLVPNITVNNNLTYGGSTDALGLIAQNNVSVGLLSPATLTIDAALVAENGRVGRNYYNASCVVNSTNYYARTTLNLLGMIVTATRYGFQWTGSAYSCGGSIGSIGSGYCTRNITYDGNLLYSPPPDFPLASTQYQLASWKQLQ